jgi:hypothetical protein
MYNTNSTSFRTQEVSRWLEDDRSDLCQHVRADQMVAYAVLKEDDSFGPVVRMVVCKDCYEAAWKIESLRGNEDDPALASHEAYEGKHALYHGTEEDCKEYAKYFMCQNPDAVAEVRPSTYPRNTNGSRRTVPGMEDRMTKTSWDWTLMWKDRIYAGISEYHTKTWEEIKEDLGY